MQAIHNDKIVVFDFVHSCFKEQRYKINASNSQQSQVSNSQATGCFKEQRYKINASNSQHWRLGETHQPSCFKEQRYKINASNSQRISYYYPKLNKLFQRAKIQDKCKQFTTLWCVCTSRYWLFQRAKIQDKCKQFTTCFF